MPYLFHDINEARLRGPGPYLARSASDNTDDWFIWYVAGPDGRTNVLQGPHGAVFLPRAGAEQLAHEANQKRKAA